MSSGSASRILVIDDEPATRQVLAETVRKAGYAVETAIDVASANARIARGDIDIALCDMQLPDGSGIEIIEKARATRVETTFVVVTAFASVETAVAALRAGAFDYIIKPVRHPELLHRLGQVEAMRGLREENRVLRRAIDGIKPACELPSAAMATVERLVAKVAPTDSTALITGENGTGKGVVARRIHERSARGDGPFVAVNCAAIPEGLLESEFFGNTKGAFTSADKARKGLFLEAEGGTLFLDEIGELPLAMQTKLLHTIEDKQVRAVGSTQARRVDVRIVAATNRDLPLLVREQRFREDLFFRLSMFEIPIRPLRERPEDIAALISFFLDCNCRRRESGATLEIDPDAEEALARHRWPGNVRELENVINRACILVDGDRITLDELPPSLVESLPTASQALATAVFGGTLRHQLQTREAEIIAAAIREAGGDRKAAARRLGISLSSLYSKLSRDPDGAEPPADGDSAEERRAVRI